MRAARKKADERLRAGDTDGALAALTDAVRASPGDGALRVFLFQLLAVRGEWSRARTQLDTAAELDGANLLMAQTYRELLKAEAEREAVLRGERGPLVFGEPPDWIAGLVQALSSLSAGDVESARQLIDGAFNAAPAISGAVDGQRFEWLADADMRLGPVIEAMLGGRYYWIPMQRVATLTLSEPEDLRDLVWLPAHFAWTTGGTGIGFVPTRYSGEITTREAACALARRTVWRDLGHGLHAGAGQRVFATDQIDHGVLDVRRIAFNSGDTADEIHAEIVGDSAETVVRDG